ncbi:AAA family ATPase [Candidatus Woesearchaeota archaeon]|nr:AAA family ATPase [Candidatus Woesearchaeota archaeon]
MEESVNSGLLHDVLGKPGITLVHGPAGTGKTLACLEAVALHATKGKVIYIDCHVSSFPFERLMQITQMNPEKLSQRIFFIHPRTFIEQGNVIKGLQKLHKDIALIVVDNITYLYRLRKGGYGKSFATSKALMEQMEMLAEIAERLKIPVLVTSHVYASPEQSFKQHNVVGGKILERRAAQIIALSEAEGRRKMNVLGETHKAYYFTITEKGIRI